jgi:hypothetical protein
MDSHPQQMVRTLLDCKNSSINPVGLFDEEFCLEQCDVQADKVGEQSYCNLDSGWSTNDGEYAWLLI